MGKTWILEMKKLLSIFDRTMNGMAFLAGVILIFIMLSVCMEVILRDVFSTPQMWVTQVTECLLLYITFLGSAWLLREEGHVKVDILLSRLRPRTGAFLGIISSFIGVIVSVVITICGSTLTWRYLVKGMYTPTVMEIPLAAILVIIPVGSLMLLIQFIRRTCRFIAGFIIESN
jgi:TRAP-type C4-dicarboxylate transport system permease small subunit